MSQLAWGRLVSAEFRDKVRALAAQHGRDPSEFMSCMAFETGETFSPSVRNKVSGATGLIQFMRPTAVSLGTSLEVMAVMTAEHQLDFVSAYFRPYVGRLHNLGDVYMAILWPLGIGKEDSAVLFDRADPRHPAYFIQNRGLDWNSDGKITRAEAYHGVANKLTRGLLPQFCWTE